MTREWTPAQLDAINAQGGSVIVSAAAGSGKTAVLVQRVLSRITNPNDKIDIDKLLIVTYTRAAAAEMKERISAQLELLVKQFPEQTYYRKQLMLLPKANISTIHSFCGNIIKENFYLVDNIPSDYKIADESELSIIKNQAVENVIEQLYDSEESSFRYMADCFSTAKGEYNLKNTVLDIYEFLCSQPFPDKWMDNAERNYEQEDVSKSVWGRAILNEAALAADFLTEKADECIKLFEEHPELGDNFGKTINDNYKSAVDEFKKLVEAADWDGLYDFCHRKHSFGTLRAAKGYASDPIKIRIANICSMIKDEITKQIPKLFIYNSEDYKFTTKLAAPAVSALFETVRLFGSEYQRLKAEENLADFSDLEHWALTLLYNGDKPTPLAQELSESFCEVMVDEYQDANEVQDLIFNSVSDNGNKLFVVGDVKQSIYRFRQANPELFLRRKNSYKPYDREVDNYPAKIVLDKNFRSRSGIAQTVNFIFSKLMSPQAGDMYYQQEDMLHCGAKYQPDISPDTTIDMLFLPKNSQMPVWMAEARLIAKKIASMKNAFKVEEHGEKRSAKFSDFAILLRNNTHALDYLSVLKDFGIPAQCQSGDNYLDTKEISVIISFLKVINNPLLDVPLLDVLTSPVFAFTPTELADIRADSRKIPLYRSIEKAAKSGNRHCCDFCETLAEFRRLSSCCSLSDLLEDIFSKTSYPEIISSTDGGELKLNNLRLFRSNTIDYTEAGGSLSSYIRYLDKLKEQNIELKASRLDGESSRVRIMTIHGSKGLEFPVCFVAGISSIKRSDSSQLLMHPKLGVGAAINYIDGPYRLESVQKQAIKMQQDIDDVSEELRVLYVALTRAKEKLYMLSSFQSKDIEKTISGIAARLDIENKRIHPYVVRSFSTTAQRLAACNILYAKNKEISNILSIPTEVYYGEPEDFWQSELLTEADIPETNEAEITADSKKFAVSFNELERRLALEYRNDELSKIPVKVSVSELAHKDDARSYSFAERPAFLSKEKMTAAQKGTAIHTIMQFADYAAFLADPLAEILRLVNERYITQAQADIADQDKITACLKSDIMQKFLSAEKTYREYRFAVKIRAAEVYPDIPEAADEEILLQGAVDCAYVENGRLVVIDYKTDRIKTMDELKNRYQEQLRLYSYAMKISTGFDVERCVIYSFALDDTIQV